MERRVETRVESNRQVILTSSGAFLHGQMVNLSSAGCLIDCPSCSLELGQQVDIGLAVDMLVSGRVAWRLGNSVGIKFHEPIAGDLVRSTALDEWLLRQPSEILHIPRIPAPD